MEVRSVLTISIFNEQAWQYAFGNFLDEFYRSTSERRQELINEDIRYLNLSVEEKAYLAASVHKLANDFELQVPTWVFDSEYRLREPFFARGVTGDLRFIYLYESPIEFKYRNIFTSRNTLSRA